ncbi:general substrate transporter [Xylariomycetidae sp. FL2044]|nr:general substrate transporter [Xylariomycetidae sp. FL2044]KAH9883420.1 general substrate transporter [Xylariomycetidae sp. FL2044]KAH9885297.1 general substrate transporter [Xylariomycetidae sp. FL2044]
MSAPADPPKDSLPPSSETTSNGKSEPDPADGKDTPKHSARFWAIIAALAFTALCSSLEGTIITSALPTITDDLGGGNAFIWVPNGYFLATIVMLPLMAQASNLFGRRWLTLISVALFTLGSGICGGANSQAMLIGGRVVQGLGGGGIALMINIIVTDMVPLRERGKYMGIVQMVSAVGAALGPFLGGLMTERSTWRWVFYINLPIGGTSLVSLFIFLELAQPPPTSWKDRIARIDFTGNAIFVASTVSVLIGITWGGQVYEWNSYHVIVPLVLGFVGLGLFVAFEWTLAKNPSLPRDVLLNRTAATVLGVTFLHTICTYWAFYFVPIYFQSVLGISSFWSGVNSLPLFAGLFPFAIIGGNILSRWGRYKPLHLIGMGIMTIAFGLLSLLDQSSSTAAWACFQLLLAIGAGLMIAILLPAMQAPLDESLVALSTGTWTFIRGFGTIWGVTIPSAIFNNECRIRAGGLSDNNLAQLLNSGKAYQYATQSFLDSIGNPSVREEVVNLFRNSMRNVWYVGIAFAGLGWLLVWLEKEVTLRSKLNTKFGLEEKNKDKQEDVEENQGVTAEENRK